MTPAALEKRQRRDALAIFKASLDAALPARGIERLLRLDGDSLHAGPHRYDLSRYRNIHVIGAGKASAAMAHALEKLLGRRIRGGLINTKYEHLAKLKRVQLHEAGHPVPDDAGIDGARRIAQIAREAGHDDLLIALISGGASALLPLPADPVNLAAKQAATKLLLACGATIHEINAVRKHISAIKGGQLARLAAPATLLALLLSDVIGDPLDTIGSGPAAPDDSTFEHAWNVFEKYGITAQLPASVRNRIDAGRRGEISDTPKTGDPCFRTTRNLIVGSNRLAVDAAAVKARELGYRPVVLSTLIEGETREIAAMHCAIAREALLSGRPAKPPVCLISGGETTVTLKGDGKGGRNMEFALAAALALDGIPGILAFSAGTDGTDGPTDAAGAFATGSTAARARASGLHPQQTLARNNSYPFFQKLDNLVITGPTGTNVMDVRLLLAGAPKS
jgi:glycerate 2-kinase